VRPARPAQAVRQQRRERLAGKELEQAAAHSEGAAVNERRRTDPPGMPNP
jgi:hypothetical protein